MALTASGSSQYPTAVVAITYVVSIQLISHKTQGLFDALKHQVTRIAQALLQEVTLLLRDLAR